MTARRTRPHIKNWLITENSQSTDPVPLSSDTDQKHNKTIRSRTIGTISVFLIAYPLLTHASILESKSLKMLFSNANQETLSDNSSRRHNSQTAPILQAATNLDPNPASGGAELNIIDDQALVAESGVGGGFLEINSRKNDQISIYQVKEGDTISQIANMFEVSVNTIKWANGLDRPIAPGDSLVILPISGIKHTVKAGGTISDIAKKYGADPKEIALFNGVSVDADLAMGQVIIVPNVDLAVEEPKKTTKAVAKATGSKATAAATGSTSMTKPVSGGYRSQGIHGYNAVDLAAPVGTPIYASLGGTAIIVKSDGGWNGGYGNYVVIKHSNGTQTLYAHMSSVNITQGATVGQADQIGAIGMTGKSTGAHLHFEVRGGKNPF